MGIDWLFDIEDRAFDLAIAAAEDALAQDFTYQQRRLLRLAGQELDPVVRDAYEDYREREDTPEGEAANQNSAPTGLYAGQTADVLSDDEAKAEA